MQVTISNSILSRYSETTIGYLLAEVQVKSEHPEVNISNALQWRL